MDLTQKMIIFPAQLTLEEENRTLGLKFIVDFFNVPEDNYAGLVRVLRIENLAQEAGELGGARRPAAGHPVRRGQLQPEAHAPPGGVVRGDDQLNETGVPYFKSKVKQEDRPEVTRIKEGNFYTGFVAGQGEDRVKPLVDPEWVFGSLTDYSYPHPVRRRNAVPHQARPAPREPAARARWV